MPTGIRKRPCGRLSLAGAATAVFAAAVSLRLRGRPEPGRNPVVDQPSVWPGMGVAGEPDVERLTCHVRRVLREDRHLQVDQIRARPVERVLDLPHRFGRKRRDGDVPRVPLLPRQALAQLRRGDLPRVVDPRAEHGRVDEELGDPMDGLEIDAGQLLRLEGRGDALHRPLAEVLRLAIGRVRVAEADERENAGESEQDCGQAEPAPSPG